MNNTKYIIKVIHSEVPGIEFEYYLAHKKQMLVWCEEEATQFENLTDAQAFIKDNLGKLKIRDIVRTTIIKLSKTEVETTII